MPATKEAEVNVPTQLEPYPTGNPPVVDMMAIAHPQIVLEKQRAAEAEAASAKKAPEPKAEPKKPPMEPDDDKDYRKGRK